MTFRSRFSPFPCTLFFSLDCMRVQMCAILCATVSLCACVAVRFGLCHSLASCSVTLLVLFDRKNTHADKAGSRRVICMELNEGSHRRRMYCTWT